MKVQDSNLNFGPGIKPANVSLDSATGQVCSPETEQVDMYLPSFAAPVMGFMATDKFGPGRDYAPGDSRKPLTSDAKPISIKHRAEFLRDRVEGYFQSLKSFDEQAIDSKPGRIGNVRVANPYTLESTEVAYRGNAEEGEILAYEDHAKRHNCEMAGRTARIGDSDIGLNIERVEYVKFAPERIDQIILTSDGTCRVSGTHRQIDIDPLTGDIEGASEQWMFSGWADTLTDRYIDSLSSPVSVLQRDQAHHSPLTQLAWNDAEQVQPSADDKPLKAKLLDPEPRRELSAEDKELKAKLLGRQV